LPHVQAALDVYRGGYQATLLDTLREGFPVVGKGLGSALFRETAQRYTQSTPSVSYNLSHYGSTFPEFLGTQFPTPSMAFLPHLARFEWVFREVFHAAPPPASIDARQNFSATDILSFFPATRILSHPYPVYPIWRSEGEEASSEGWEYLLLHKSKDQRIWVTPLTEWQFEILEGLQQSLSLETAVLQALDRCEELDPFSIQRFFSTLSWPLLGEFQATLPS